jgi:hypothetical protein
MVIFHSYVAVYQRVNGVQLWLLTSYILSGTGIGSVLTVQISDTRNPRMLVLWYHLFKVPLENHPRNQSLAMGHPLEIEVLIGKTSTLW